MALSATRLLRSGSHRPLIPYMKGSQRNLQAVKQGIKSGIKGMLSGSLMGDFSGFSFSVGFVKGMATQLMDQFDEYLSNPNQYKSAKVQSYMQSLHDTYTKNLSYQSQSLMLLRNALDKYGEAYYLQHTNRALCQQFMYDAYSDIVSCKNLCQHDPFTKLSYIYPLQLTIGLCIKLGYLFDIQSLSNSLDITHCERSQVPMVCDQYEIYLNHLKQVVYDNIYHDHDVQQFIALQQEFKATELNKPSAFDQYENEIELFDLFDMKLCSLDSFVYVYMDNLRRILVPNLLNSESPLVDNMKLKQNLGNILFFDCPKSEYYWFQNQFVMDRNRVFFERLFADIEFDDIWFCDYTQNVYQYVNSNESETDEKEWRLEEKYNNTNLGLLLKHYLSLGWNLDKFEGNYILQELVNGKATAKEQRDDVEVCDMTYFETFYEHYTKNSGLSGMIEGPINDQEVQDIANVLVSPFSNPSSLQFQKLSVKQLSIIKCALNERNKIISNRQESMICIN